MMFRSAVWRAHYQLEITESYQNGNFLPFRLLSISKRYQNDDPSQESYQPKRFAAPKPF
jgi:hypothetical protein